MPEDQAEQAVTRERTYRFARMIRLGQKMINKLPSPPILLVIAFLLWVVSGFFIVAPDEIGVIKRFGRPVRQLEPGPHYHMPFPIESALKPEIKKIQSMEIGRTAPVSNLQPPDQNATEEWYSFTGDDNMVIVSFSLQYRIKNVDNFLFKVADQKLTLKSSASAAMREVIGRSTLEQVLSSAKKEIQEETLATLQKILDMYESGIEVVAIQMKYAEPPIEVRPSFRAVVSARENRNRLIVQARHQADQMLAEANGQAETIIRQAEAHREEIVQRARGDAAHFIKIFDEYQKAGQETADRIYLESMEEVLTRAGRIILEPDQQNILPLLNLPGSELPRNIGSVPKIE